MSRETLLDQLGKLRRFILVGLIAAGVDIGGMQALILAGLDPLAARAISLPVAMLTAFILNRAYTFGASHRSPGEEMLRYGLVNAASAATSYAIFAGLIELVPGIVPALAAAVGLGLSMWVSFFGAQFFAFGKRRQA